MWMPETDLAQLKKFDISSEKKNLILNNNPDLNLNVVHEEADRTSGLFSACEWWRLGASCVVPFSSPGAVATCLLQDSRPTESSSC